MKLLHEILAPAKRKMTDPCIYVAAVGRVHLSKSTMRYVDDNNSLIIADNDGNLYCRFDKNVGFRFHNKKFVFTNKTLVEYLAKHYLPAKAQEVYYSENRTMRLFISEEKKQLSDGKEYHRLTKEAK